ncbi:MAG TPA: RNA methyltransferase [Bacteroidales bacterium]|nr:RNA methyltransferase [Bacteroidales bacterium]
MRKLSMDELGRPDAESFRQSKKLPVVAVLDNIRSLHNVGSVFRSADAFSIEAIYLCGITACPPHREISKSALGATETVQWHYFRHTADCLHMLADKGYALVGIEQTDESIDLQDFVPSGHVALIFGNEMDGLSDDALRLSNMAIEIPQTGTKHSLNVSVCAGIVFWHCFNSYQKFSKTSE